MRTLRYNGATANSGNSLAQFDMLCLRLIKIAARVLEMKTMTRVHLPTSCPAQDILRLRSDVARASSP